jgi:hypothetical protein
MVSGIVAEMTPFLRHLGIVYLPQIYGFTSPPKKGMLRIVSPENPTASAGFEPANLGTRGQHAKKLPSDVRK